jgi:hypothetical protein
MSHLPLVIAQLPAESIQLPPTVTWKMNKDPVSSRTERNVTLGNILMESAAQFKNKYFSDVKIRKG